MQKSKNKKLTKTSVNLLKKNKKIYNQKNKVKLQLC